MPADRAMLDLKPIHLADDLDGGLDLIFSGEVGDCAGHFQDAGEAVGAEIHLDPGAAHDGPLVSSAGW